MRVFKNYFKLAAGHKFAIILYSLIFGLLLIFSTRSVKRDFYVSVKPDIYINDEAETDLSRALVAYLDKNTMIREMDEDLVEDKLFYQMINAAVVIPKDFDQTRKLDFKNAPNDMYGMAVKENINQFLNQVASYERAGFEKAQAIDFTSKDLDKKIKVDLKDKSKVKNKDDSLFYFNFLNYLILSQVILIVSTIVKLYKKSTIAMRNEVSAMPKARMNLELILGHIVTGVGVWLFYVILFALIYKYDFKASHTNLMILNSLVFTITVVAMAVMLANLIGNENVMAAIMQVVGLGSSFLCGAFVPQEFLSKTALNIGKILPSYYYIKNNNMLIENPTLGTILPNMRVMLAFALVFVLMSLFIRPKAKRKVTDLG